MSVHEEDNKLIWESRFPITQTRDTDKQPVTQDEINTAYNTIENSLHVIVQDMKNKIKEGAEYDGNEVDWNDKYYKEKLFAMKKGFIDDLFTKFTN